MWCGCIKRFHVILHSFSRSPLANLKHRKRIPFVLAKAIKGRYFDYILCTLISGHWKTTAVAQSCSD